MLATDRRHHGVKRAVNVFIDVAALQVVRQLAVERGEEETNGPHRLLRVQIETGIE